MHQLRYRITNLAPIIFSERHGDANMTGTLQFIPGTSVLGMMASRFLKQKKISSPVACSNAEFHRYFLKGNIRFGNAFIMVTDKDGDQYVHFPAPNSIHQEKRGDQIYDLLRMEDDEEPEEQTKATGGFCHLKDDKIRFMEVETNLNFHHARDRNTGVSKDEMIFNYESISTGQTFQGVIKGDSEDLKNLVSACGNQWTAYIGRSKNAQYGKVRFEWIDNTPQPISDSLSSGNEISLTLLSDTILYNENGFSTTDPHELEKYLGVKIKTSFIRQNQAETFVGVWRLKKPSETCFKAGSCFLLENISDADKSRLIEFQKTGIGERTHEGYGQCMFGWQTDDKLTQLLYDPPVIKKPTGGIPQTTKDILKSLIQQTIRRKIVLKAMEEVEEFRNKPTPSLIGRLNAMAASLNREKFIESMEKLRRSAADKLKNCRNNRETLMDFLMSKSVSAQEVLQQPNFHDLQGLCKDIGYTPENDGNFDAELYRIYLTTFFSTMRKIVLQEERHDSN